MKVYSIFSLLLLILSSGCNETVLTCKELKGNYLSVSSKIKTVEDSVAFVRQLERLKVADSFCVKAKELLAEYYINAGRIDEAKALFTSNVRIDSNAMLSHYQLAELLRVSGDYEGALKLLQGAIRTKETDRGGADFNDLFTENFDVKYGDLLLSRGMVLFELQKYDSSYRDFTTVLNWGYEDELCRTYLYMIRKRMSARKN